MSTKALEYKAEQKQKFRVRQYRRCQLCGRSRAVYRKFKICRICFRTLANEGKIPGVRKARWYIRRVWCVMRIALRDTQYDIRNTR